MHALRHDDRIRNATGYGARALWKDESIVPIRGQIAWLIPQPEVNYSVFYKNVFILSRRDGILVQDAGVMVKPSALWRSADCSQDCSSPGNCRLRLCWRHAEARASARMPPAFQREA